MFFLQFHKAVPTGRTIVLPNHVKTHMAVPQGRTVVPVWQAENADFSISRVNFRFSIRFQFHFYQHVPNT